MAQMHQLGIAVEVPANASRFMPTAEAARSEPTGTLDLVWDPSDPYVFNQAFDSSLIRHDEAYCTAVVDLAGVTQIPTLHYFEERVLPLVAGRVVDIGCGRGEFVTALRERGIDAVGYDPVLPEPTEHLRDRYWDPGEEESAGLFVMRCVLPHIPDPWAWVEAMGKAHPEALLLVEYQRLEWMLEHGIWYMLCHDHVNQFVAGDFRSRFEVLADGRFNNDEWGWSLIRPSTYRPAPPCASRPDLTPLWEARSTLLSADHPVVPWGAAGKGIVLAHALLGAGVEVPFAIDADPKRQGLYMEVSGVLILGPDEGLARLPAGARIRVANPNHESGVVASGVDEALLLRA